MKTLRLILTFAIIITEVSAQSGWQTIANAPYTGGRINDVSFISDSIGWLVRASDLYKTTDAGQTWSNICTLPTGSHVRSIEFLNDSLGFYGTLPNGTNTPSLFKTTNGGISFTKIDSLLPIIPEGFCGMAHFGNTIICVGVWYGYSKFYKSTDGGNNWTYADLSVHSSGLVDCYMFDQNNYLLSGSAPLDSGFRANILRTSDGGNTWQQVAICSASGLSYMWKMFFLANGLGFASVEEQPMILKTTDYGNSWSEIIINDPNATVGSLGNIRAIGAINDSVIWAGRQYINGMFETTDGGQNWLYYPFGSKMDRMALLDSTHVICVGTTVYKYAKGGVTGLYSPDDEEPKDLFAIINNPVINDHLKIKLQLSQPTFCMIDIIDMNGRLLKNFYKATLQGGLSEMSFSVKELKDGTYTLTFRSNEISIANKVQIIR